jgi:transcriptional regulator with PAS, ATPase and Fis domain
MTHQGETTVSTAEILPLRELERKHILKVYEYSKRNKRRAAKLLGISLRTLYNKLSEYDEHAVQNDQVSA